MWRFILRFQKGKVLLMIAVASWILFTLPIGFIHPPVVRCKWFDQTTNKTTVKPPNWEEPSFSIIPTRRKRSGLDRTDSNSIDKQVQEYERLTPDTVVELPRALPLTMDRTPSLTLAGNRGTRRYRHISCLFILTLFIHLLSFQFMSSFDT